MASTTKEKYSNILILRGNFVKKIARYPKVCNSANGVFWKSARRKYPILSIPVFDFVYNINPFELRLLIFFFSILWTLFVFEIIKILSNHKNFSNFRKWDYQNKVKKNYFFFIISAITLDILRSRELWMPPTPFINVLKKNVEYGNLHFYMKTRAI